MPRTRYLAAGEGLPLRSLPAAALRVVLKEGYSGADLRRDVMAGLVVGVVALPLSMALAIAVGVKPQQGLYTAIIAGLVVAALGGSRTAVTGPTAAFIVILAPIVTRFGLAGLLVSGLMGGLILLLMGLFRLGRMIEFIPHPVTTGFTAGVATVIATLQLKDFFGLRPASSPEHYFERVASMWSARHTASVLELGIGAGTLAVLLLVPRLTRKVPAPIVALPLAAVAAVVIASLGGGQAATIGNQFQTVTDGVTIFGIPRLPPLPLLPWEVDGGAFRLDYQTLRALVPGAFAVAILGAIESLLCAVVADGMIGTKHDPDAELLALGVGNIVTPFFGGIPATGALARTATAIRNGARSPVASITHALVVLLAILALAPAVGYLPMASLAALLLVVAWNMSEARHFMHIIKVAPKSDVSVLLVCFGLTVAIDMVVAVTVGVMLAALLFMRRMAEVTSFSVSEATVSELPSKVAEKVLVYEIAGPLFFGAAQRAINRLGMVSGDRPRVILLRLDRVLAMDATGLVALESVFEKLSAQRCRTVITGLQPQPEKVLRNAHIEERYPTVRIESDFQAAVTLSNQLVAQAASS